MKHFIPLLALTMVLPLSGFHGSEAAAQSVSVAAGFGHAGYFYAPLRSYGEWIEIEPGFFGWRPVRIRHGWRPYLYGRWTWTDYGWYWHSSEPFGWAVYHYGRWHYDDYYGWIWIPDTVWGPAWVEWRYNNDYIGWAPLPPYASFSISVGIRFTTRWYAPPNYWCFVRYRNFASTHVDGYVVDEGYSRRLIRTTRGAVRYEVDRDRVINRGIDRDFIERRGDIRISRTDVGETRERNERLVREGGRERIEVYRPSRSELERREERIDARRPDRRISLDLRSIERRRGSDERSGETRERRSYDQARPDERATEQWRDRRESQRREPSLDRRPSRERPGEEFRSVRPDRERTRVTPPATRQPERRDGGTTRSQPRRDERPAGSTRSSGKRGRDD